MTTFNLVVVWRGIEKEPSVLNSVTIKEIIDRLEGIDLTAGADLVNEIVIRRNALVQNPAEPNKVQFTGF